MPAGNIPRKEHRVAYTYLVEHSDRLGVERIYSSAAAQKVTKKRTEKSKTKRGVQALDADLPKKLATKASKLTVPSARARASMKGRGKPAPAAVAAPVAKKTGASKKKAVKSSVKRARKSGSPVAKKRDRPTIKTRGLMVRTQPPLAKKRAPQKRVSSVSKKTVKAVATSTKQAPVPTAAAAALAPSSVSQVPALPAVRVTPTSHPAAPSDATFSVLTLTGKRIVVPYSPTMTLLDLQQFVQQSNGIPVEMQRYIFNGREVGPSDASLKTIGIEKDKSVYLILRLRGDVVR